MEVGKDCIAVIFLEPLICSVTTPGTEQTAASDTSAHFSATKEGREKTSPQPSSSAQRGGSPIIQEPEELHLHQDDLPPRRTSLVIVESIDDQPEKLGSGYEEESLEKVNTSFSSIDTEAQVLCLVHSIRWEYLQTVTDSLINLSANELFPFPRWL